MSSYARRLEEALEKQHQIKGEIEFLRLLIKKEKKQTAWCSKSPDIKALKKLIPNHRIDNGAGLTYFGVTLECTDKRITLPDGWVQFDNETWCNTNTLASLVCKKYKKHGVPIHVYINQKVC